MQTNRRENNFNAFADLTTQLILTMDNSVEVTTEFVQQAFDDDLSAIQAAESWFADGSFDITRLEGLKGRGGDFFTEVEKLQRPYIRISDQAHAQLESGKFDYYLTPSGQVVTFGRAGEGPCLMPLNASEAAKLLAKNGQ